MSSNKALPPTPPDDQFSGREQRCKKEKRNKDRDNARKNNKPPAANDNRL